MWHIAAYNKWRQYLPVLMDTDGCNIFNKQMPVLPPKTWQKYVRHMYKHTLQGLGRGPDSRQCTGRVILPSGISSDCRWPLDVAGRKLCVKWKMNILVTFCINFATRSASRHSLFQVWNVRKICQQSQRTRACRTSRHKLAHCEGLATLGNSKLCGINHCMCPCMHQTLL